MEMQRSSGTAEVELPGFRFHPTEEELLDFYLRRAVNGKKLHFDVIATVHLYRYNPWDLPSLAKIGEREWYFYVPRDRRQANGGRPSRTTERGFWKATGSDRPIRSAADPKRLIGLKKTLVYYQGRAPRGTKTDWVMNEYRLPDANGAAASAAAPPQEDIVLCKIYRKATSLKELEQRAAMAPEAPQISASPAMDSVSCSDQESSQKWTPPPVDDIVSPLEFETKEVGAAADYCEEVEAEPTPSTIESAAQPADRLVRPTGLAELEVPKYSGLEWMQDPFLTQLRSPWMEQWSPYYASGVLNF
ncbi:putative NAC domain-containing protein 94 [Ananas comosus]|uniref:NAC domain-containing protein 94 n=2 Tax=Ananas comosus TaxID=4615 RepID=A0A6P5E9Z5_ANACO|nr:putative NAC domain-containing protein 94 [Ananas comosus]